MVCSIEGVLAPVFTPMNRDRSLNLEIIPQYLDYLKSKNVNGILVGGTTGEHSVLNLAERKSLLECWMKAAKHKEIRVVSQVGAAPFPDVLALAEYSQMLGADAILTLPELYFKPRSVDHLVDYLQAVGRAAPDLPLLYYHFPMMSGVDLNMRHLLSAATQKIPTFKGMKADLGVAMQVSDLLGADRKIFIANHHIAPAAVMGFEDSIATVTNMFPALIQRILIAIKKGDLEEAKAQQEKLNRIVETVVSCGDFLPAMKATMELVTGLKVGPTRLPVPNMQKENKIKLEESLRALNVL